MVVGNVMIFVVFMQIQQEQKQMQQEYMQMQREQKQVQKALQKAIMRQKTKNEKRKPTRQIGYRQTYRKR